MRTVKEVISKKIITTCTCDGCGVRLHENNTGHFWFIMHHNTVSYTKADVVGYEHGLRGDYCKDCIQYFILDFYRAVKNFPDRKDTYSLQKEIDRFKELQQDTELNEIKAEYNAK